MGYVDNIDCIDYIDYIGYAVAVVSSFGMFYCLHNNVSSF
jgi:hypothetical protein